MRDKGYHIPLGRVLQGLMLFIIVPEQGSFKYFVFQEVWGSSCIATTRLISEEGINVMQSRFWVVHNKIVNVEKMTLWKKRGPTPIIISSFLECATSSDCVGTFIQNSCSLLSHYTSPCASRIGIILSKKR